MNLSDVKFATELAQARSEAQIRMRNEYVQEVMEGIAFVDPDLTEEQLHEQFDSLRNLISEAYSKGAIDCLTIIMVSDQELMEGGDHNE